MRPAVGCIPSHNVLYFKVSIQHVESVDTMECNIWRVCLIMPYRVVVKLVWRALGALSLNVGTVRTFTMRQNCSIILLYKMCH